MKWNLKNIKVSDLKENPKNPRQLTEKGLSDLEKSIKRFGVAEPLVLNTDSERSKFVCINYEKKVAKGY